MFLSDYRNMAEARQQIGHFIDVVYSQKRIHSALDYKTPAEFETQWIQRNSLKCPAILCPEN